MERSLLLSARQKWRTIGKCDRCPLHLRMKLISLTSQVGRFNQWGMCEDVPTPFDQVSTVLIEMGLSGRRGTGGGMRGRRRLKTRYTSSKTSKSKILLSAWCRVQGACRAAPAGPVPRAGLLYVPARCHASMRACPVPAESYWLGLGTYVRRAGKGEKREPAEPRRAQLEGKRRGAFCGSISWLVGWLVVF